MKFCTKCGNQLEDNSKFCPNCGSETEVFNNISVKKKKDADVQKKKVRIIAAIALALCLVLLIGLFAGENSSNDNETGITVNATSGEDYSSSVFDAFWNSVSNTLGVEYSDYNWLDTATSYIQDFETADGYIAHYYLIETSYTETNYYGQEITHDITARCYLAPDYNDTVYMTYMTLDGEVVYFDEETENWFMNMDGGGVAP